MASFAEFTLRTEREGMHNITHRVNEAVWDSGVENGICLVYCPHTTAGLTINENADPDVVTDILYAMGEISPERKEYRHMERNSHAHVKASLMGSSVTLIVENRRLVLGTWQGVFFCEFDGPRSRKCLVKVQADR